MRGLLAIAVLVASLVAFPSPAAASVAAPGAHATATTEPCGTPGVPTMSVYLPNITKTLGGPTGWQTPFIVQNVGAVPTTIEAAFYGFADGALVTCRKISNLAPATSFADVPDNDTDLPDNGQFSVVVRSFGGQVVAVVNEHQGVADRAEALSYVGLSAGATRVGLPFVAKTAGGWLTTFIVQNLGTGPAHVSAAFASADGTRTATLTRTIDPGRSQFVNPLVEPSLLDGTEYAVTLSSDQPIAVVANAHNDAAGTAAPMAFSYNGIPAATAGTAYLPLVARNTDGVGRQTRIVVENVGQSDATPALTFQKLGGGGQVTINAPAAVKPGRSWSFDPRTLADGTTACPPQGSASCVAEGEDSLSVTGTFAVLAAITSPTTAMGYAGATSSPSRVYLPNVTRTLGGPSGWTTPIIVQSAGATAATLHWYRFADGALVQTQQLTGLVAGASVRVDPRAVTGLTDDTQYAVVLDARGPVQAIVTELSAAGGDGAMAYEGFASAQTATPVPMTIAVTPATATVAPGKTQQFTASVQDQFGAPVGGSLIWGVVPSTLGTVSAAGLFTAGPAAGSGTIVVSAGTLSTSVAVVVQAATGTSGTTTIGSQTFRVSATASADVFVETTITDADAQTILALVDPSITFLQGEFGRAYAARPQIYAFATASSASTGWSSVLGQSGVPPSGWAGVYLTNNKRIGLNWEAMKAQQPYRSVRHELTHLMEHQIAGAADIPTWLDEGFARLEDLSQPGGQWRIAESRDSVASMATTSTLLNVTTLSAAQFYGFGGLQEQQAYFESAETVRMLRSDVSMAGLVQMLGLLGQGQPFANAYANVAGKPFTTFQSGLVARYKALAAAPGIDTAPDTWAGGGLYIVVFGLAPSTSATLSISGADGSLSSPKTFTVNQYGYYETYLGSSWAKQTYTIAVTTSTATLQIVAVKTTSFFGIASTAEPTEFGGGYIGRE